MYWGVLPIIGVEEEPRVWTFLNCLMLQIGSLICQTQYVPSATADLLLCPVPFWSPRMALEYGSLVWPDPIPYREKGSGTWPQSNLSPRIQLVIQSWRQWWQSQSKTCDLSYSRFQYLLYSSSWLKTLLTQHNFPVHHILQVSCDWILCCDWYALLGVGNKTALWPCSDPFPQCGIGPSHVRLGMWLSSIVDTVAFYPFTSVCIAGCKGVNEGVWRPVPQAGGEGQGFEAGGQPRPPGEGALLVAPCSVTV